MKLGERGKNKGMDEEKKSCSFKNESNGCELLRESLENQQCGA